MGETRRNRVGGASLIAAIGGFLVVEFQPWLPLASIALFGSMNLKGLLEAFFEASMAGAFADWFAVSALFRDPIGIPLPHTNILAKNKERLAKAIPRFLTGFVQLDAIAAELAKVDFASKAAELLSSPSTRESFHEFLRSRAAGLLLSYGRGSEEDSEGSRRLLALRGFVGELLDFASERIDAPGALASLLAWARKEKFDERALEGIAEYARLEIGRNRKRLVSILTPLVKRNAGWQGIFIGTGTIERFIAGMQDELAELKTDKGNELRRFIIASIGAWTARLEPSKGDKGVDRGRLGGAFHDALADPSFRRGLSDFVADLLTGLGEDLSGLEGRFIPALERIEEALASRLRSDQELRASLNSIVASLLADIIERGRLIESVTGYLAGLLRATDDRFFVERIEEAVWNDLQYIRVNGAVVGGLVGIFIFVVKSLF